MIHEREIREKIESLHRHEIFIPDFERWIVSRSWNMHKDSSREAINLASEVQILLSERHDESIPDDASLLEALAALVGLQVFEVYTS